MNWGWHDSAAGGDAVAVTDAPADGPARAQVVVLALLVVAGVATGVAWRYLLPFFLDHSDRQESYFVVNGAFAAILAAGGLVTGLLVLIWPGRYPAVRAGVAIAGSIAAAALAWATGIVFGTPELTSVGVLLIWPVVAALAVFIGSMLPVLGDRLNPP